MTPVKRIYPVGPSDRYYTSSGYTFFFRHRSSWRVKNILEPNANQRIQVDDTDVHFRRCAKCVC